VLSELRKPAPFWIRSHALVVVPRQKREIAVDTDEGYLDINLRKVPILKPAFLYDGIGTITVANALLFNNRASALVLCNKAIT
jgi:acetyl-CoA C-acetyltransferase